MASIVNCISLFLLFISAPFSLVCFVADIVKGEGRMLFS